MAITRPTKRLALLSVLASALQFTSASVCSDGCTQVESARALSASGSAQATIVVAADVLNEALKGTPTSLQSSVKAAHPTISDGWYLPSGKPSYDDLWQPQGPPYPYWPKDHNKQGTIFDTDKKQPDDINTECGYTLNKVTQSEQPDLFTDSSESDFIHTDNFASKTDWKPWKWSLTCGVSSQLQQIRENPLEGGNWEGLGPHLGRPGLQLITPNKNATHGFAPSAFIKTKTDDIHYGSFRMAASMPRINGTFASFNLRPNGENTSADAELFGFQMTSTLFSAPMF